MSDSRVLKQFEQITCPHCKKSLFIGTQSMIPTIVSTSTTEDVEDAKKQVIDRLEEITFVNDIEKAGIIDYLNSEETIIDFSDIETMLKQIAMDQIEKKKQNGKKSVQNKSKA